MRPDVQDAGYLWDMLEAARNVSTFVHDRTLQEYERDIFFKSAVERQIEIIGEAARRVSRDFQNAHPEIPWQSIVAQRHVPAHDYGEIKDDRIWRVAIEHVPALIVQLEILVPEPPSDYPAKGSSAP